MAPREAEGPAAGLDGAGTTCPTTWSWRQRLRPPPGTRWRLPLLLALALAVAPAAAFCPAGCVCNTLRISCEDAGLDVVPFQLNPEASTITLRGNNILSVEYTVNFYQHLQQLDVSQNRLQSLGSKNFDALERLVSLNVSGNELGALGKDAFRGLRALRVLDLSDNLLEQLDRHAFAEMHDLWELHLRRNRLAAVADGVFDALVNLRVLQLADNQLLAVPSGALGRLTSLRALHLSGNLLEDLGAQAFAPLRELAALALANNVIAEVHPAALEGLVALERLDLADNNVTAVPTVPLASLRRLSYLDLSGNMFAAVGPGAFHGLAELRVLRLNRLVRLTRVDGRAFQDNKRLEAVWLEGNVRLQALPARLLHGSPLLARVSVRGSALQSLDAAHFPLDRLQLLDVADVPLTCNCSLLWLWLLCREQRQHALAANDSTTTESPAPASPLPFLAESPVQVLHPVIVDVDRIRCAGPADLRGFAVLDVPEADVRCEASWMAVVMVTVVVLALFAATCAVLFFLSSGRMCGGEKDASDVSTDSFATQHSTLHHKHGLAGLGTLPRAPPVMVLPADTKLLEPTYATIGLPGLPPPLPPAAYDTYGKKQDVAVNGANAYQRALNNWDSSFNGNGTHHAHHTLGRHDQQRHKAPKGAAGLPAGGQYGTYHNHNHYSMAIDMTKKPPHIVYV
ncbi:insulin-like growth factor-binding protein complex acid labile subunit [Frankliniella occidentalis]|uniref:Insulin-like growth factor-binding protein complex acid labile subunit n=1 Tax=Frankliniella occidentalis TaxID=133901 RepID=A0A9C6TST1_FRAOC|nr:insulin-like growth factor-binding protein complex acid labile subunit [Frankliniella occidentalis]XP_052119528.1 insulin-like growth factor-binding protein complex acid labile subunit [Frankliniella occidentalis]XP_052119529.1 insulin-like growth factor-binding protein complex acid labile subunit [Frankliniella occidentalis]XP_052119530.1 insulin-like growth factor-binding protein complex acid labile subunit [Frankliniella occidentalis]